MINPGPCTSLVKNGPSEDFSNSNTYRRRQSLAAKTERVRLSVSTSSGPWVPQDRSPQLSTSSLEASFRASFLSIAYSLQGLYSHLSTGARVRACIVTCLHSCVYGRACIVILVYRACTSHRSPEIAASSFFPICEGHSILSLFRWCWVNSFDSCCTC
jgi:hypothetical protein